MPTAMFFPSSHSTPGPSLPTFRLSSATRILLVFLYSILAMSGEGTLVGPLCLHSSLCTSDRILRIVTSKRHGLNNSTIWDKLYFPVAVHPRKRVLIIS